MQQIKNLGKVTRKKLKGIGFGLKPAVMVGKDGMKESIFKALELGFSKSELVKAKLGGDDKEAFSQVVSQCAAKTKSQVIHKIGRTALFYRKNKDLEKKS